MDQPSGGAGEPAGSVLTDVALVGAASLGMFSIVLAAAAVYLVIRHQGYFYKARVRTTHVVAEEPEPVDR
ncbi:MAG: hypothetical protein K9G09_05440 [Pontimonas sp.]|nr:hypothetical protein [Pontimonas sp.]